MLTAPAGKKLNIIKTSDTRIAIVTAGVIQASGGTIMVTATTVPATITVIVTDMAAIKHVARVPVTTEGVDAGDTAANRWA